MGVTLAWGFRDAWGIRFTCSGFTLSKAFANFVACSTAAVCVALMASFAISGVKGPDAIA